MSQLADGDEKVWIGGLIPVQAVIEGGARPIRRMLVQDDRLDGVTARLQQSARERGIPFKRVPEAEMGQVYGSDRHGGILVEVGPRHFLSLGALLAPSDVAGIFMLDGVEDPFNLGQAIRSLYAAGATGLVLRERNWLAASEVVVRSSAGASEKMPTALAETPEQAADFYRRHGLVVIVATQDDAVSLHDVDLRQPFLLVIGGEKRGISRAMQRNADLRVTIPYGRDFNAPLGAAAAAAVLGFEMLRQRSTPATR